jgi:hypothetical protein
MRGETTMTLRGRGAAETALGERAGSGWVQATRSSSAAAARVTLAS